MSYNIYRGDIHNHCGISYGYGGPNDCDFYHMEVRQKNNQWAWISPAFVEE